MFPAAILVGAPAQLLPPWIPYRFFLTAALAHVAFWFMLALAADDLVVFTGGSGMVLGALHMLTLGVLVSTVMGAASQLTPVATGLSHFSLLPIRISWWLHVAGALLLIYGFVTGDAWAAPAGGALEAAALLAFALTLGDLLRRASFLRVPVRFVWLSLLSLAGFLVLGLTLIFDFSGGFLADRQGLALAHLVLAAHGFMGLLVLGFSNILVPMFALSDSPPATSANASLILAPAAIAIALGGIFSELAWLTALAAVIGLAAVAAHLHGMAWCLRHGQRKRLGLSFTLIKGAWVLLLLNPVLGGLLAFGLLGETGPALFGFALLAGWLLTFLTGILQRIVPFLAGMNMAGKGVKPPRLSQLADERLLGVHAWCHAAAILAVAGGIAAGHPAIALAGTLAGTAGSLALAWYIISVARSFRAHQLASRQQTPAPGNTN